MSDDLRASDNDRNRICQALDAALGDGQLSTEEHRERVSAATRATTLRELQALVADLQIHPATEQPASRLHGRRAWIAVTVALVLLAAAIAWGLQGDNPSGPSASTTPTTGSVAAGSSATTTSPPAPPPPRLLTLSGVSGFLAQMRAQFGDTLGYQLNIYQEQAVVERPDTANPHKVVSWLFRDGNWTSVGPEMAVASRLVVGDLSTFDVQAVVSVVQQAPQTLHIYDANQLFLTIESRKDGGLRLQINASDGALSGTIVLAADGTVTDIAPPVH
ncbi:DUF1707 SHOCT-like domain-containing protein [Mycobacterium seoulense]|uniref:DUF1707 domain-containing protein n=1 Tax=Mycobacterium seoulense TaxID=386911 RepID=A0A7I7NVN6_9MYCO|nr:DUF1707 domain-containing protein [Mycobacterium seoulense]MCV7435774.1 DUF1707 domain-containing protein [Mycobacterium seoulense]BBY00736.1 hypothetical protein MSEO_12350 [Mycobacterium seoulense]